MRIEMKTYLRSYFLERKRIAPAKNLDKTGGKFDNLVKDFEYLGPFLFRPKKQKLSITAHSRKHKAKTCSLL
jgi:hypothetical protein